MSDPDQAAPKTAGAISGVPSSGPAGVVGLRYLPLGRRGDPAHFIALSATPGLCLVHSGDRAVGPVPTASVLPRSGGGIFLCPHRHGLGQ